MAFVNLKYSVQLPDAGGVGDRFVARLTCKDQYGNFTDEPNFAKMITEIKCNQSRVRGEFAREQLGEYTMSYTPTSEGTWWVKVWVGQRSLFRDGQVSFTVGPQGSTQQSSASRVHFQMSGFALTGGCIDQQSEFQLHVTDENRRPTIINLRDLSISLIPSSSAANASPMPLTPTPDVVGRFNVIFTVKQAGLYAIVVRYKGYNVCMQNGVSFTVEDQNQPSNDLQDQYEQAGVEDNAYY